MKTKTHNIIKMNFTTPLHLSRGQTDAYDKSEEILHSDTIKSAIFVTAKMLFGKEIDEAFFESFRVSSAFPYKGKDYFFPKPMAKLDFKFEGLDNDKDISKVSKKLKKLEFISKSVFEDVISGKENIEVKDQQFSKKGKFLFSDEITDDNKKQVYKSEVQQRLATAKPFRNKEGNVEIEKDGTPYYIDRIYFTENSGLYFFIEYLGNSDKEKINAAIKLLGDEGVGTDKHIGNGIFEAIFPKTFDLKVHEDANSKMLLSLYCPKKDELQKEILHESSYQLIKRGGYIASPENIEHLTFRKKSVYMFQEASIFPNAMQLIGKIENLKPDKKVGHPVWRDGYAFSIPFEKNKNNN